MPDSTLQQEEPYDIEIWGGKSFALDVEYVQDDGVTPIAFDVDADQIVGQIRAYSSGPLQATFTAEITDAEGGAFRLSLTGAETKKITNRSVYEVALVSGATVIGLLRGDISYTEGVIV